MSSSIFGHQTYERANILIFTIPKCVMCNSRKIDFLIAFGMTAPSTLQISRQRVDPLHVQDRASLKLRVNTTTIAIYNTLDVLAPLRNVPIKSKARPWVTPELRSAICSRNRPYRRARRNPTVSHIAAYRKSRSAGRNILDSAKNRFLSSKINTARDSSACWRALRGLGLSCDAKPSSLLLFLPDELNNHYASVSRGAMPLSEKMVNCAASLPVADTIPTFTLHQVTEIEVLHSINSLCSKGTGIDNIPASILKLASTSVITELTAVVNKSIELSCFPSSWKRAVITPLSKTNTPSSPSDTRPIAQLPEMAKILERIVHHQLLFHLTSHGLLNAHQFGFRPGHSTQTAVLDLTESIRRAIDKRKVSMVVSFDFSKAFDTISHCRLIEKLRLIGCSAPTLGWFASYLTGRSQTIHLSDGSWSSFVATTAGVPQGSVLRPLLFLVFINDLSPRLSSSQHMIYADDTQIFCSGLPASPQALLDNANNDVSAIAAWADENGIRLNTGKTNAMLCAIQTSEKIHEASAPARSSLHPEFNQPRSIAGNQRRHQASDIAGSQRLQAARTQTHLLVSSCRLTHPTRLLAGTPMRHANTHVSHGADPQSHVIT
ncbi:unnamed protein product [Trichogramma brassicae]|uniref:Reverse transcriptase domain-containing protein n=1 Tax=Trichogramma brassicae TaxID=86971 RepID=A0A6H5I4B2_9HYME|nr:unnamed protein product [Trichogramma brassicae]